MFDILFSLKVEENDCYPATFKDRKNWHIFGIFNFFNVNFLRTIFLTLMENLATGFEVHLGCLLTD
jgi:hypothetical protein